MPVTAQNAGKTPVYVNTGAASALELLGWTRNGAEQILEGYFTDVPGDEKGGDLGPPIDIQFFGEVARIRIELTKFDFFVLQKVKARVKGTDPRIPGTAGTFLFQSGNDFKVWLGNANMPKFFPRTVPRAPIQKNLGSRFAMVVMEFDAYTDDSGILWNTATS